MQSIAARVLLALAQKYRRSLLRVDPSAPETSHEESVARADAVMAKRSATMETEDLIEPTLKKLTGKTKR